MTNHRRLLPLALIAGMLAPLHPLESQSPQPTGRIVGRVLEESTGSPVPGAQVAVVGTRITGVSAIDGRYTLLNVPAGTVSVGVRAIGYSPKTVEGVVVPEGAGVALDVTMASQAVQVEGIVVSAAVERGTVNAALEEQRNAVNVVSSVSAEQIARSPDSDAGQAVQRVSGVTVQDGRYVFIRGLGERYTTTSLNGARMPSPEPERRVVPLDLFPSGLLDGISTTKTFTPDQPGDFSGGQVNLRTREFPLRRTFTLSMGLGMNDGVTGRDVPRPVSEGSEWFGMAGSARELPGDVRAAGNLAALTPAERSAMVGSFRNAWSAGAGQGPLNGSTSLSLGGEDPVLGVPLGYLFSFGYSNGQDVRRDEHRSRAIGDGSGGAVPLNSYSGPVGTVTTSVLWGGMANLTLRLGSSTKITAANTLTRSGDNQVTRLAGFNEEFGQTFDITRLSFVERSVRSNQLRGEHLLWRRHQVDWSVTSSGVRRYEPDRSDLLYEATIDSATGAVMPGAWWGQTRGGDRTFSELDETALDLSLNYRLELSGSGQTAVKVGFYRRSVSRDADSRVYQIRNVGLTDPERGAQPPESVFANPGSTQFDILADPFSGRYTAEDAITAGYVQLELPFGPRLRAVGGVRVERWGLDITSLTPFGTTVSPRRRNTDVLPGVALTWSLGPNTNVRASASQTVSRPEYREIVPLTTRDIAGGYDFIGNDTLQRALIRNFDLRWEWYPSGGEVISVGVFAKFFDQPIERVLVATVGATAVSPENTDRARNIGVELEVRRNLGRIVPALLPFSAFANVTLMSSEITLKDSSQAAQRNVARPLTGQARYVVNAGLGYQHPRWALNATLLYNVVGRRIHEVGTILLPDAYEEPRHLLDFSMRFPIAGDVTGRFDAKNLLDSPYEVTQGAVTRLSYHTGRTYSLGLSWSP